MRINLIYARARNGVIGAHNTLPEELWVIGGAQLFATALPLAERAVVTELEQDFAGDVYAPPLDGQWQETAREQQVAPDGMRFAFVTYIRRRTAADPGITPA